MAISEDNAITWDLNVHAKQTYQQMEKVAVSTI
jgi:hypothetical protein